MQKLDYVKVVTKIDKSGIHLFPKFDIKKSNDVMIRGSSFYAIWNEAENRWSRDPFDAVRLVDEQIAEEAAKYPKGSDLDVSYLRDQDIWNKWISYIKNAPDNYHQLDANLTFLNTATRKEDYASTRLDYALEPGDYSAYDELISTLYDPAEREKLEWAVGSIVAGAAKDIQKFIVIYGESGSGKSTILGIIQKLFTGYYSVFNAKALGSSKNDFALEAFKNDPLVGIQHDGDLSRIEDNTVLNSVTSHEVMLVNEKFKSQYQSHFNCFLFMGTNKPVKITDAKSGIIRRLIDVYPSGRLVSHDRYDYLMTKINFELGAIASHCLDVFNKLGIKYYDNYKPTAMIGETNDFYNFVEDNADIFSANEATTLKGAWDLYKEYCDDAKVNYPYPKRVFKVELKNYFKEFHEKTNRDGKSVRNVYTGFLSEKFFYTPDAIAIPSVPENVNELPIHLMLDEQPSIFDKECADCKAQYANPEGLPIKKWDDVQTTLSDIDTTKLHYVMVPQNHIVVDFDMKNEDGSKNLEKNLEAASRWPATYAEVSKSGAGVHLHYIYDGDPLTLSNVYDTNIEIKVFSGKSSLRRMLTKCNDLGIAHISSGLPKKREKSMVSDKTIKSEKTLRELVIRNLNKEIHPGTKPSIDFINHILEEAYNNPEMHYDITDMRPAIMAFANNSTNHAEYCVKLVTQMKFKSEEPSEYESASSDDLIFFDTEVFPNLFILDWKRAGDHQVVKQINPSPQDIEEFVNHRIVGFNNRKYDNHILYARIMGYTNLQLFDLSCRIINGSQNASFVEAYNLSYADVYDFSTKKQSLKKWELELGIHHQELDLPWNEDVDESMWGKAADYCENDVIATEATFNHNHKDFIAREMLAEISGLSVNDTNRQHTERIIFGNDRYPQTKFVYTDLSTIFPGYKFENGKSWYRGEDPKEGGYVYSEPGMYSDVALLDIASMHPHSIIELNLFGDEYTKKFADLVNARIYVKHRQYNKLKDIFDGKLYKFFDPSNPEVNPDEIDDVAKTLAGALKIPINSVYGLTSAKFPNKFRDPRNKDNIVAKRGALFMIDLKHAVQEKGFTVAHIKTDSIKIPNATPEIIKFVQDYGKKYGYEFEHEATYSKMCLVNDAVYIAKESYGDDEGKWTATGAQFAVPYVFKTLFSHEAIVDEDLNEVKAVTGDSTLYLDMNEGFPDVTEYENELKNRQYNENKQSLEKFHPKKLNPNFGEYTNADLEKYISDGHHYEFVGKAGAFVPIKPGFGGGILYRVAKDTNGNLKYYAAAGTKGYRWLEKEIAVAREKMGDVDFSYFNSLVDDAVNDISKYGDIGWFLDEKE